MDLHVISCCMFQALSRFISPAPIFRARAHISAHCLIIFTPLFLFTHIYFYHIILCMFVPCWIIYFLFLFCFSVAHSIVLQRSFYSLDLIPRHSLIFNQQIIIYLAHSQTQSIKTNQAPIDNLTYACPCDNTWSTNICVMSNQFRIVFFTMCHSIVEYNYFFFSY